MKTLAFWGFTIVLPAILAVAFARLLARKMDKAMAHEARLLKESKPDPVAVARMNAWLADTWPRSKVGHRRRRSRAPKNKNK